MNLFWVEAMRAFDGIDQHFFFTVLKPGVLTLDLMGVLVLVWWGNCWGPYCCHSYRYPISQGWTMQEIYASSFVISLDFSSRTRYLGSEFFSRLFSPSMDNVLIRNTHYVRRLLLFTSLSSSMIFDVIHLLWFLGGAQNIWWLVGGFARNLAILFPVGSMGWNGL